MQKEELTITTRLTDEERTNFRLWLQHQFTERCKKNSRYSLRAFAKQIDLDASSLSQILSGSRPISKKMILTISSRLSVTPKDLKNFGLFPKPIGSEVDYLQLTMDRFSSISDWYHYAILELTFVPNFKEDAKWISKKLNITVEEAKAAIERLKRLGLLFEQNGLLIKTSKMHTNHSDVNTSVAHRELQRQLIEKALIAVDECPVEKKDITSMTMAIDVANLDKARALIQKFRRDLCALLEDGEQSQVYNLAIQLYPVSNN